MPEPDPMALVEPLRQSSRRWKLIAAGLGCLCVVLLTLLLLIGTYTVTLMALVERLRADR